MLDILKQALEVNGLKPVFKEDKQRLFFGESRIFTQYIQLGEDYASIRIYLKNKKMGEQYTKAEWRECFKRREEVISLLNDIQKEIVFNVDGETNSEQEEE